MLVPQYWAEASVQVRSGRRQRMLRRFGWSEESQEQAQQLANERATAAKARLEAGDALSWREPKVPYNGASGVPIREGVVSRHGPTVITRNAYGALCLNTENVLFADLDFETAVPGRWLVVVGCVGMLFALGIVLAGLDWEFALLLAFAGWLLCYPIAVFAHRVWLALTGGVGQRAMRRIYAFSKAHPDWHLRVYRTPAGFRVLVLQKTFDPSEADVALAFSALEVDKVYQRMCLNQQCFRARVSPKPWRMGIQHHMRPRPGVWPVAPEHLPARQRWVEQYQQQARNFASCRFVERLGSSVVDPAAMAVQRLHDELCRADSTLPLA